MALQEIIYIFMFEAYCLNLRLERQCARDFKGLLLFAHIPIAIQAHNQTLSPTNTYLISY